MIAEIVLMVSALQLARPVVETGCRLIETVSGEPLRVLGDMLADNLYMRQWRGRIKMADRAQEILDADGVAPRVLPDGFLSPLLYHAGWTGDDEIAELWARLLAAGIAADQHQHPGFVGVLSQLSPVDAQLLNLAAKKAMAEDSRSFSVSEDCANQDLGIDSPIYQVSISNLQRLGLLEGKFSHVLAGPVFVGLTFTDFGQFFCDACRVQEDFV